MTVEHKPKPMSIGNVAVLDLRTATEEAVDAIQSIGNVATIITSPETSHLTSRLRVGNIAFTWEVEGEPKIISGNETLSRDSFKHISEPLNLLVLGNLTIAPDIPVEEFEAGLSQITIAGNVLCPDNLSGVVNAKAGEVLGNLSIYPGDAQLVQGNLSITEGYLNALPDGTKLTVLGNVKATEVLPNELLKQKIAGLFVIGRLVHREENSASWMASLQVTGSSPRTTAIPTGYTFVEQTLVLDNGMLSSLPSKKLYCGTVQVADDVDADTLNKSIDSLKVTDMLTCPERLRSIIAGKCNLLETDAIFYKGELWLIEDQSKLLAPRFTYLEDKATLIVSGILTIAEDVEPAVLAQKIDKVHNMGIINCTLEQQAALQSRAGISSGIWGEDEFDDDNGTGIGNAAYLKI